MATLYLLPPNSSFLYPFSPIFSFYPTPSSPSAGTLRRRRSHYSPYPEDVRMDPLRNVGQPPLLNTMSIGTLLYDLPCQERSLVRKLEKTLYKLNSAETAVTFNQTCINEGLLPKYTHLRLHDPTAADDCHTRTFRRRLAERQLKEKELEVRHIKEAVNELYQQWNTLIDEQNVDRAPLKDALSRLQDQDWRVKESTILRKLITLNGGKLRLPENQKRYINLTSYTPNPDEETLLQLGLNCHYADRPNPIRKRLEIETLLESIASLENKNKIKTSDSLRPLLLAEALTSRGQDQRSNIVSRDLRDAAKNLKSAEGITIRRADKTPALVLINTEEYQQKLDTILADASKFRRITRNPTEDIKREANKIIERVNALSSSVKFQKIKGDYDPGYIYGNVKTHKNGNPLRPIISQIPTPTYRLAKHLNDLLSPYIPSKYRVQSSTEFLHKIKGITNEGSIASLDVESLFTNVPVEETISMICEKVYRDDSTPTLALPEDALRDLLRLCTMKAPFTTHRGHIYTQVDGVAMGSPLGVLFADFYMGVVEERVFGEIQKPEVYCRYVDDTFVKTSSPAEVERLRLKFEEHSSLHFTVENSEDGKLPFLDVLLTQNDGHTSTSVYRKKTNLGLCLNGRSECPDSYRRSTIGSYIRRALSHCSSWKATSEEIDKATQILINNGFTNKEISRETRKIIDKWYTTPSAPPSDVPTPRIPSAPQSENLLSIPNVSTTSSVPMPNVSTTSSVPIPNVSTTSSVPIPDVSTTPSVPIPNVSTTSSVPIHSDLPPPPLKLFYMNQFHRDYKKDEAALRSIIHEHVTPTNEEDKLKLIIYYKNRKTSNLILKNNPTPPKGILKQTNVVYHYKCPILSCTQEYVGMTTMRLSKRISCHAQEGAIYNHLINEHNIHRPSTKEHIIPGMTITDSSSDPRRLRLLEALHILRLKPSLNCTQEPLLLPTMTSPQPIRGSLHPAS